MTQLNNINIVGRLTRDPESREAGEHTVCNISIALDNGFGEKKKVCFVEVQAWNKTADFIQNNFTKGKEILIEGKLEWDSWDDKETGKKRSKNYITANKISFVGSKSEQSDEDLPF